MSQHQVNSRAEAESLIWLIRAIYDVRDIKNVPSDDLIAFLIATDKFGAERLVLHSLVNVSFGDRSRLFVFVI